MTADHHQDDQDVDSLGVLDGNDYKTIVEMETFKSEVGNLLFLTNIKTLSSANGGSEFYKRFSKKEPLLTSDTDFEMLD